MPWKLLSLIWTPLCSSSIYTQETKTQVRPHKNIYHNKSTANDLLQDYVPRIYQQYNDMTKIQPSIKDPSEMIYYIVMCHSFGFDQGSNTTTTTATTTTKMRQLHPCFKIDLHRYNFTSKPHSNRCNSIKEVKQSNTT